MAFLIVCFEPENEKQQCPLWPECDKLEQKVQILQGSVSVSRWKLLTHAISFATSKRPKNRPFAYYRK